MSQPVTPDERRRSKPAAPGGPLPDAPSSSRMFASYLTDIEQLLDDHAREAALREALDLPRLAVALADPQLRCPAAQLDTWCTQWVRPPGAERDAQGLEYERLTRRIAERAAQLGADRVPARALRRLQLHRNVRTPAPRGYRAVRAPELSARDCETVALCNALIGAGRRWYARSACHDPTVQANLARLAVLR